jgi:ArsR family transcriptional regulator
MEQLIQIAKVFSDENRIKIIALLMRDGPVCVCEICDTLQLSQPLVSRHLKQMKTAGMIHSEKKGKWMLYSLAEENEVFSCWIDVLNRVLPSLPGLVVCSRYAKKTTA